MKSNKTRTAINHTDMAISERTPSLPCSIRIPGLPIPHLPLVLQAFHRIGLDEYSPTERLSPHPTGCTVH